MDRKSSFRITKLRQTKDKMQKSLNEYRKRTNKNSGIVDDKQQIIDVVDMALIEYERMSDKWADTFICLMDFSDALDTILGDNEGKMPTRIKKADREELMRVYKKAQPILKDFHDQFKEV